jgi:ribose-phosphate pyrophosphokinase
MFEAVGVDAVVTLEVHNESAFENAFRCPSIALSTAPLLIGKMKEIAADQAICVVSPDLGGGKRADLLREALEKALGRPIGKAFVEKHRSAGVVSGDLFAGEVANALCIVVDDLISTGGTLVRAAKAARAHGAREVIARNTPLVGSSSSPSPGMRTARRTMGWQRAVAPSFSIF